MNAVDERVDPLALAEKIDALATEILDPFVCRTPAYGAPGRAHCAACCGGTGFVITMRVEKLMVELGKSMHVAARVLRQEAKPGEGSTVSVERAPLAGAGSEPGDSDPQSTHDNER